ncbi:MAG: hypothetical protein NC311_10540 [Muribaculaceae bacterium]|nr:hypothetical protein [Muribaculaceae bacterium]
MSEKKRIAPASEAPIAAVPKFTLEALREKCVSALGIEQSTFDGAFYGVDPGAVYTLDEAKAHVTKWLNKPLKLF